MSDGYGAFDARRLINKSQPSLVTSAFYACITASSAMWVCLVTFDLLSFARSASITQRSHGTVWAFEIKKDGGNNRQNGKPGIGNENLIKQSWDDQRSSLIIPCFGKFAYNIMSRGQEVMTLKLINLCIV